jgi:hypothetical protein
MSFEQEPLSYLHAWRVLLSKSEGWIEAAYGLPTLPMEEIPLVRQLSRKEQIRILIKVVREQVHAVQLRRCIAS